MTCSMAAPSRPRDREYASRERGTYALHRDKRPRVVWRDWAAKQSCLSAAASASDSEEGAGRTPISNGDPVK